MARLWGIYHEFFPLVRMKFFSLLLFCSDLEAFDLCLSSEVTLLLRSDKQEDGIGVRNICWLSERGGEAWQRYFRVSWSTYCNLQGRVV